MTPPTALLLTLPSSFHRSSRRFSTIFFRNQYSISPRAVNNSIPTTESVAATADLFARNCELGVLDGLSVEDEVVVEGNVGVIDGVPRIIEGVRFEIGSVIEPDRVIEGVENGPDVSSGGSTVVVMKSTLVAGIVTELLTH